MTFNDTEAIRKASIFTGIKTPIKGDIAAEVYIAFEKLAKESRIPHDDVLSQVIARGIKDFHPPEKQTVNIEKLKDSFASDLRKRFDLGESKRVKKGETQLHLVHITIAETTTQTGFLGQYVTIRADMVPYGLEQSVEFHSCGNLTKAKETLLEDPASFGLSPEEVVSIVQKTVEEVEA